MQLPPVGLGTMGIEDPGPIVTAIEVGYRHVDTARIYGNEGIVGDALATSDVDREDVTVATKLWIDALSDGAVGPSARESADLLGVETIDLLYVHRPRGEYDPVTTLPALDRLVDEGLVDAVGVSNFEPADLDRASDILDAPIAAHQTELHPLFYRPELVKRARESGYPLVGYSPLAGGRVETVDAVVDVAKRHETTPEAVAIAWALEKEPVVTVPKASSRRHLRANLAAADLTLDRADVAAIDAIESEQELFPE